MENVEEQSGSRDIGGGGCSGDKRDACGLCGESRTMLCCRNNGDKYSVVRFASERELNLTFARDTLYISRM